MMAAVFISVDVESDGPVPGDYSMLQIGACVVGEQSAGFEVQLQPISDKFQAEALAISGLDRSLLARDGVLPYPAMASFERWVKAQLNPGDKAVFVGNNAPYDWMFVCWYFHHFLGHNPFGHSALDIRSYAMGVLGVSWQESGLSKLPKPFGLAKGLSHDALDDARQQAACFETLMKHRASSAVTTANPSSGDTANIQTSAPTFSPQKPVGPGNNCPHCGADPSHHQVLNYDPVWRDGDLYCMACHTKIRSFDAG